MRFDAINEMVCCAYYDLNCRHIHDNEADIKLDEVQRSQNTFCAYLHLESHELDANKRYLKCS